MPQQHLEQVICDYWEEVKKYPDFTSAAKAIDLQGTFRACGSVFGNLAAPEETDNYAVENVLDALIGRHDDWRICCHEAGHAIAGVKLRIPLERIARGHAMEGVVEPVYGPEDDDDERATFQTFYAAGAAAERIVFGTEARRFDHIVDPLKGDKERHCRLECRQRTDGFEDDICGAMAVLECGNGKKQIEKVAALLMERRDSDGKEGRVTEEEVADITGDKLW